LADRSSRPSRSPRRLSATVEKRIERLRRDRNLGPDRIAYELRREGIQVSASGVHRVLVRLGISRLRDLYPPTGEQLRQPQRQPQHPTRCAADSATSAPGPNRWRRYERERPGELIHIDEKKLGHIRPGDGWWAHSRDSAQARASRSGPRVGYDYVHVAVDDHSRLAYVEVITSDQGGENAAACAGFLRRAAAFYAGYGIHIEQVMTDNAFAYARSRLFAATLADIGATHKLRFHRFSGVFQDWFDLESQEGRHWWQHRRSTPISCASARCGCIGSRPHARRFGGWASSSTCTPKPCATGSARTRPTAASATTGQAPTWSRRTGGWPGRTPSCGGSTRSCARRVPISPARSARPGGGHELHRRP